MKKKKEDKELKILKKDQEVLFRGPAHCELCKVIDVKENSALLSNGVSVLPKYNKNDKILTPLNLKGIQFTILAHGSASKRIWKEYCLGNNITKLQNELENFKKDIIPKRIYGIDTLTEIDEKVLAMIELIKKESE